MKTYLFVLPILLPMASFGADLQDIERLKKNCEREKSSRFTNKHTPSCHRLDKLLKEAPVQNPAATYQWSWMYEKFCYHNEAGEVTTCP